VAKVDKRLLCAYVLSRTGCIHPFRLSRILALIELEWMRSRGERLSDIIYVRGPGTFYIEGLKEAVEEDPCFEKRKGDPNTGRKGCIEYKCEVPQLPEEVKKHVDEVLEKVKNLDEFEINKKVVEDELFQKISKEGGGE
jgi:hydroxypyruvate isomerase